MRSLMVIEQNLLAQKMAKEAEWTQRYLAEGYTVALNQLETEIRAIRKNLVAHHNEQQKVVATEPVEYSEAS